MRLIWQEKKLPYETPGVGLLYCNTSLLLPGPKGMGKSMQLIWPEKQLPDETPGV